MRRTLLRQLKGLRKRNLQQLTQDLGIELQPLHPGTTSAELAGQYYVTVNEGEVERVLQQLRQHSAVEAAYVKPTDEPPSRISNQ